MLQALLGAARRFVALLLLAGCSVTLAALVLGFAVGESPQRSIAVGLYLGGSFLVVAGIFIGNRGPARPTSKSSVVPFIGSRMLRWATKTEREETLNESAIFVTLGLVLIVLGAVADSHHRVI